MNLIQVKDGLVLNVAVFADDSPVPRGWRLPLQDRIGPGWVYDEDSFQYREPYKEPQEEDTDANPDLQDLIEELETRLPGIKDTLEVRKAQR